MENTTTKWNKEAIFSFLSLSLSIIIYSGLSGLSEKINFLGTSVRSFDWFMFWHTGWRYASIDLAYSVPAILGGILLVASIYFGLKSIRKAYSRSQKGRMLGIISTTLALSIALLFLIGYIISF